MKKDRLFSRVLDEFENEIGYIVIDVLTGKRTFMLNDTIETLLRQGNQLANAELINNQLVGTEASLQRLPICSKDGRIIGKMPITIIRIEIRDSEKRYRILGSNGKTGLVPEKELKDLINKYGCTNAKIREGVVSAIKGHFEIVDVQSRNPRQENKDNTSKSRSVKDAYKQRKYVHGMISRQFDRGLIRDNNRRLNRAYNLNFAFKLLGMCGKPVELPYDKIDIMTERFKDAPIASRIPITSLKQVEESTSKVYLRHFNLLSFITGEEKYINQNVNESLKSTRDFENRKLSVIKRVQNSRIKRYNICKTSDSLVERKEVNNEFLSSSEFNTYYNIKTKGTEFITRRKERLESACRNHKRYIDYMSTKIDELDTYIDGVKLPYLKEFLYVGRLDFAIHVLGKSRADALSEIKSKQQLDEMLPALTALAVCVYLKDIKKLETNSSTLTYNEAIDIVNKHLSTEQKLFFNKYNQ